MLDMDKAEIELNTKTS